MWCRIFFGIVVLLSSVNLLRAQDIDEISPMSIYNIGLVGCDTCGLAVLKHFIETGEARCVALWGTSPSSCEAAKDAVVALQSKVPTVYEDYTQMLERRDMDILLIALPGKSCSEFFIQACRYDKNIYIELFPGVSTDEIAPLIEASHDMSGVVQVGCHAGNAAETKVRIRNFLSYLNGQTDILQAPLEQAAHDE